MVFTEAGTLSCGLMVWYCSCKWLIQILALQRDSDSSDHVTTRSVKDKLRSWQYSSLDSDDLSADLDKTVAEVAAYPKDSVTDGIAAVAAGMKTPDGNYVPAGSLPVNQKCFADVEPN